MWERIYSLHRCCIFLMLFFIILFTINLFIASEISIARQGNTLYVGGTGEYNYTSIQDAIIESMEGDSVVVYAGIYNENIIINKSIRLLGVDKNNVTINGNDGLYSILIKSSGIMLSGFTIQNSNVGIFISGPVFKFCNISHNILTNNSEGIRIINSSDNNISSNSIKYHSNFGIVLYDSKNNAILNNTIIENNRGIYLGRWSNYNLISKNNFTGCYYGLYLDYSFNNQIIKNLIQNGGYGIYLTSSNNNNVTNNYFAYNKQTGIYTSSSDENVISPNIFFNNNQDVNKKTKPPSIKTPGFEILLVLLIFLFVTLIKKNK